MIKILDNFFSKKIHKEIYKYCNEVAYNIGEKDSINAFPVGGVFEIKKNNDAFGFFDNKLKNTFEELKELKCYRAYINCFFPNENPTFHRDADNGYTCLYYPNVDYELNEGGETQFFINNEIKGVLPIPNRMILFDANLEHKATSFRSNHRFTLALKYKKL